MSKIILAISDLQIPFQHPYALKFLKNIKAEYQPDVVVSVGDETDQAALGRYPKDPDGQSAGDELKRARRAFQPYFDIFPEVYICNSNHQQRLYKRAFEAGIPRELICGYRDYIKAPEGWQWQDYWIFDGIKFEHGDRASGIGVGQKLVDANGRSTVFGHHHATAGLGYVRKDERTYFWMNVGCLIDENSYAMAYTRMHRTKPIHSCGVIIDGVPRLIPMLKGLRKR
jgi:hypothetical protein